MSWGKPDTYYKMSWGKPMEKPIFHCRMTCQNPLALFILTSSPATKCPSKIFQASWLQNDMHHPTLKRPILTRIIMYGCHVARHSVEVIGTGLLRVASQSWKLRFATVFGRPTSTKWREGCLPPWPAKPTLRLKGGAAFWKNSLSQQLFSAAFLSSFSQQPSWAIILLWSGVGGQLLTTSCCKSSRTSTSCGQLWARSLKEPFRNAFGKNCEVYVAKKK